MGGYRFGQMSMSSFFTRHNPQPKRVNHFKGNTNVFEISCGDMFADNEIKLDVE